LYSKEGFKECIFIGEGNRDASDIMKERFSKWVNNKVGVNFISPKKSEKIK